MHDLGARRYDCDIMNLTSRPVSAAVALAMAAALPGWAAPWTVEGDLSYTAATERLNNPAVKIGTLGTLEQLSSIAGVTKSIVTGMDTANLANYGGTASNFQSYTYDTEQHFRGGETAGRLDVTYTLPGGFVTDLEAGLRVAGRMHSFRQWSNFGAVTTAAIDGTSQWYGKVPLAPFYSATESNAVRVKFCCADVLSLRYRY